MFAGIVETTGTVVFAGEKNESFVLGVQSPLFMKSVEDETISMGDSVSISGVCLSAISIEQQEGVLEFDLASETRRCTILGELEVGSKVNLERSMQVGERLHGHFVQGHVDSQVEVVSREDEENTIRFGFSYPEKLGPYIAPKGSVSINGVSLTVGEKDASTFSVYIIPHTLERTTFDEMKPGDRVNVEIDMLARYLYELLQAREA